MPLTKEEAVVMTEDADTFTVVRRLLLSEIARRKEQSASFVRSLTDSRGIVDLFRCGHEAFGLLLVRRRAERRLCRGCGSRVMQGFPR
jgi:hypothetical protein